MTSLLTGDLSQHFQGLRHTQTIKARMQTLTSEMSTGRVADIAVATGGDMTRLAAVERDLALTEDFLATTQRLEMRFDLSQIVLSEVDDQRSDLANQLVRISPSTTQSEIAAAGQRGIEAFNSIVNNMNRRDGDQLLFAGRAIDGTALAPAANMLTDILASIGAATTSADIRTAVDSWFDDPAGGFATLGYTGDTGAPLTRRISETETLNLGARADNDGVTAVLKGAALAAISEQMGPTITQQTKAELLRQSADALFSAATPLTRIREDLGYHQERVELARVAHQARQTSFGIAKNEIVSAEPYETATRLQQIQQQLELHFTSTSRIARLSLANFI